MRIGEVELVSFGKSTLKQVGEDVVGGLAAEMSYRFFLSLFPFFIFLAAIGGFVASLFGISDPTDRVMNLLGSSLPSDTSSVIRTQVGQVVSSRNGGLLSIAIIGSIWAASSAFQTVMKGMNRAYDVDENRKLWTRYGIRLGLTLLAGAGLIAAFVLLFFGQLLGRDLADSVGLGSAMTLFLLVIRWPVAIFMITAAVAFVYWAAPNVKLPFKLFTPGAVIFTILWLVGTFLFGLYVSNFGSYNVTYGALGGIVVLLVWFYLTAYLLLLGAEINTSLARQAAPEQIEPRSDADEARGYPMPDATHRGERRAPRRSRKPQGQAL